MKFQSWAEARSAAERGKLLCSYVEGLRRGPLQPWRTEVLRRMRLYTGAWAVNSTDNATTARTRFNLVRMCCDTALSILGATRTLPYEQTRGADWDVRRKAMRRTRALQTQFSRIGVFDESLMVQLDAVVTGLGVLRILEDEDQGGTVGCERCLPLSIAWDPASTVYGEPREVYQVRLVDKAQLKKLYPSKASLIERASPASDMDKLDFQLSGKTEGCELVQAVEAWRLPSATGAKDGLHCIAVAGGMLVEDAWEQQRLPFAFLRGWQPNQLGFPGCSISELTEEAQVRCDELREFVTQCQHLASGPALVVQNGATAPALQAEESDNAPFRVIRVPADGAIQFMQFEGTPQDLQQQYQLIAQETLAMLGLNSQQVAGQVPSGVESGTAMRTLEDIQSKRHIMMLRHLERYYLDAAKAIIEANDRLAKRLPSFEVERETRARWLETSQWTELRLEPGESTVAVLPVSALVGSQANQQETLAQWVNQGWCDEATAKQLQNHPDTEGEVEEEDAAEELVRDGVDAVLDGEPAYMDPMVPPQAYLKVYLPTYYQAARNGAPPEVLSQLQLVVEQAKAAIDTAMAAQQAAQQPMPPPGGQAIPAA